jgi:hypothetical protein
MDKTQKLIRRQRFTIGLWLVISSVALFAMNRFTKEWQEMAESA